MIIKTIRTRKIKPGKITLEDFLGLYIKKMEKNSVIAVSSKIISLLENRVEVKRHGNLKELVETEATFIASTPNCYGRYITITNHTFVSRAGIDQSNGNGCYILLPKNPQRSAKNIYQHLAKKSGEKNFGVIITDSSFTPLRAGAVGLGIGFWGFRPLKDYVGRTDIFGRKFHGERANTVDALAAAAVLAMGEGDEQTPLAVISKLENVEFSPQAPSQKDLDEFYLKTRRDKFHQFYEKL